jgi:glutathione synthase/RimK-type ligase-like ATP-grasp enzyme
MPSNNERKLVPLLREIAAERQINFTTFSQGWIIRLEKAGLVRHVYGYNFGLNPATAQLIADDKSAVSDLLAFKEVPHVDHYLFTHPRQSHYVASAGNWPAIIEFAQRHQYQVVCKPNDGTGGRDVYLATNPLELEQLVHQLFETHRAICLSPYHEVEAEYRVIFLNGAAELIFAKRRPAIRGDGRSTVIDLIAAQVDDGTLPPTVAARAVDKHGTRLNEILPDGSRMRLDWRHNLEQGARPEVVEDQSLWARLEQIATAGARELNIHFASIDIIQSQGQLLILEVNAGVMMEKFIRLAPDGYVRAKAIYARAVEAMFDQ